jgi:hypothetical protein
MEINLVLLAVATGAIADPSDNLENDEMSTPGVPATIRAIAPYSGPQGARITVESERSLT